MTRTRRPVVVAATAAASAVLLLLPTAAQAHDPSVAWLVLDTRNESRTIGTAAKTDAALTALANSIPDDLGVTGIDIRDEQGYGVGTDFDDSDETYGPVALIWDHKTGETAVTAHLQFTPADVVALLGDAPEYESLRLNDAWGLDAAPGAGILTLAEFAIYYWVEGEVEGEGDEEEDGYWRTDYFTILASVDIATGALTPLAFVQYDDGERPSLWYNDVATDPTTGRVYLVGAARVGDGEISSTRPVVALVDVASGTVGSPEVLTGVVDEFGGAEGVAYGADFERDGKLWLSADMYEFSPHLISIAPGFTSSAAATDLGVLDNNGLFFDNDFSLSLAVEDAPKLPDTGAPAPFALAGFALVLAAAGAGALALHRREVETVR